MSSETDISEEETSIPIINFNLRNKYAIIENPQASEIYNNGYFGQWNSETMEELKIEPEELLLLLDRGRIEIHHSSENRGEVFQICYMKGDK